MPDGLYRPYFHGELVAEYRKKSAASMKKMSANGVEPTVAQSNLETSEEYVEPGTKLNVPLFVPG